MSFKSFLALLGPILLSAFAIAQPQVPQDYFRSPVDIPIILSGTFGEPRSTHFHSGLDIKTQGREGLKIYAVADGYISRIKISPWGYGNALYIKHPNGYESVYAHLKVFNDNIASIARSVQYDEESFAIEYYPAEGLYPVTKGEVIAYSGNTGGSGGPHLHFEIRDSLERPLNPLLFGYSVPDNRPPALFNVSVANMDRFRFLSEPNVHALSKSGGSYLISSSVLKVNSEKLGFGIHTYDQLDGASNKNGVYAIELYDNGELKYHYRMDRFDFSETRHVHCHMDPKERDKNGRSMHRCFSLPGNGLSAYPFKDDNGMVDISDGELHEIEIRVLDYAGNQSTAKLSVQRDETADYFDHDALVYNHVLPHDQDHRIETDEFFINLPEGTLFDTMHLSYSNHEPVSSKVLSEVYTIGDHYTGVFDWFSIGIDFEEGKYRVNPDKITLVHKDENGRVRAKESIYEDGFIVGEVREFGQFYLLADTVAPVLSSVNVSSGMYVSTGTELKFSVSDNLSGVAEYSARIDGKWVLLEYDAKRNRLTHKIDGNLKQGERKLVLEASDRHGNVSSKIFKLNRN